MAHWEKYISVYCLSFNGHLLCGLTVTQDAHLHTYLPTYLRVSYTEAIPSVLHISLFLIISLHRRPFLSICSWLHCVLLWYLPGQLCSSCLSGLLLWLYLPTPRSILHATYARKRDLIRLNAGIHCDCHSPSTLNQPHYCKCYTSNIYNQTAG